MTALCPYGENGCPDNEGDYDVVMPEPLSGTSGSGYKVRNWYMPVTPSVSCHDADDGVIHTAVFVYTMQVLP